MNQLPDVKIFPGEPNPVMIIYTLLRFGKPMNIQRDLMIKNEFYIRHSRQYMIHGVVPKIFKCM